VTTTINSGIMGFISLGVIYMIIGLVNRDIWKKSRKENWILLKMDTKASTDLIRIILKQSVFDWK
jgi:hypothetical protein